MLANNNNHYNIYIHSALSIIITRYIHEDTVVNFLDKINFCSLKLNTNGTVLRVAYLY